MSYADKIFKEMCEDIMKNGTDTKDEEVRPHWEDGTPAYTVKQFGVVNRYDLRKGFPALTLRKTGIKSAFDEILWIWQKKSNNIHDLHSHVWDEWADENGSIGRAYGYQQALLHPYPDVTYEGLYKAFPNIGSNKAVNVSYYRDLTEMFGYDIRDESEASGCRRHTIAVKDCGRFKMTQLDKCIYDLVNTPFSRRCIVDMWNPEDSHEMALTPCAYSVTFNVTKENGKMVLNAILNQRSQDILAANNWNVCQYALLLMMIARHCGYEAGQLVHVIADAHIYDRHIPLVKKLIQRQTYPEPNVALNPEVHNFYKFTVEDLIVENYMAGSQIKDIPIAI